MNDIPNFHAFIYFIFGKTLANITNFYFTIRDTGINITAIIKSPRYYDLSK